MSPSAASERQRVLIVEDDPDIRDLLGDFLEMHGCVVTLAADGGEAFALLRREEPLPRFILLDLTMPGMNGAEFRAQQERDPRLSAIPIVIVSADPESQANAVQLGAAACLKKPIQTAALLDLVRRFAAPGDAST